MFFMNLSYIILRINELVTSGTSLRTVHHLTKYIYIYKRIKMFLFIFNSKVVFINLVECSLW